MGGHPYRAAEARRPRVFRLTAPRKLREEVALAAAVSGGGLGLVLLIAATVGSYLAMAICGVASALAFFIAFFLLVIGPRFPRVMVSDQMVVWASPYAKRVILAEEVRSARILDVQDVGPIDGGIGTTEEPYCIGQYTLRDGRDALVLRGGRTVLCLDLAGARVLLAPDHFDEFVREVDARFVRVTSVEEPSPG